MTSPAHEHDPADTPEVSPDFFQGNIAAGLEKMRRRLLDLTARNRLLNFRYGKKSSLRVIDELPDVLFSRLIDGKELYFKPVPKPRRSTKQNQSTLNSDESLDETHTREPSAEEHARTLGLSTSFDLPVPENATEARHGDREIQTCLFPDDLESVLRAIGGSARLAIEETGTNMLFLVFGFLEWYESEDSNEIRLAPLVLVPVTLTREAADPVTRTFRYSLRHSGEEVVENISLQERLRQDFALDLPELADDETPESYFLKLKPLLEREERWKVRRQVTLTLLSFGKLLMYKDLESSNWPRRAGPEHHPRIKEFFQGIQREGITIADDYALDSAQMAAVVPPVIEEADSSQHSALVDAMGGRSIVIAGPPGTGKSQTITNLIAAALAVGKTVLFVSEKLAALEVVRHRLDNAGLGLFCLELHSHKAQKRQLLDDIQERIQHYKRYRDPVSLDTKLRALDQAKKRLTEYAALINRPFGRDGRTLWEIMWASQRRRRALAFDPHLIQKEYLVDTAKVDPVELGELRQRVQQFAEHLRRIIGTGQVSEHPWYGLSNIALTFLEDQRITDSLAECAETVHRLADRCAEVEAQVGDSCLPRTLIGLRKITEPLELLPRELGPTYTTLLAPLRDAGFRARLLQFANDIARYHHAAREIVDRVGKVPTPDSPQLQNLLSSSEEWQRYAQGGVYAADIGVAAQEHGRAKALIDEAFVRYTEVQDTLGLTLIFSASALRTLADLIRGLKLCSISDLHLRHEELRAESATTTLREAIAEKDAIRKLEAELQDEIDLELVPDSGSVKRFALATSEDHWWNFLRSEFRAARTSYRAMSKSPRKPSNEALRKTYRQLLELRQRRVKFGNNARYREVSGPHFQDVDTPLERLLGLAEWYSETGRAFSSERGDTAGVVEQLWRSPREPIASIKGREGEKHVLSELFRACTAAVEISASHLRRSGYSPDADLQAFAAELGYPIAWLTKFSEVLAVCGFPEQLVLGSLPRLLQLVAELNSAKAAADNAHDVERILGSDFRGVETSLPPTLAALQLYQTIAASTLPPALKSWLLHAEASRRLLTLHEWKRELLQNLAEVDTRWVAFDDLAKIDQAKWFSERGPFVSVELDTLIARFERAQMNRATLALWLDYIRARENVRGMGLPILPDLAEQQRLTPNDVVPAYDAIVTSSLVRDAFTAHPDLAEFSGLSHEQVRSKFAELDRESIVLYRARAAHAIDQRQVPEGNGYGPVGTFSERNLLEHEISKQKRHIPVRQLVRRSGQALQALKPCFMMGPLSVAQYLAPGYMKFDLVIMDEASQLRPEDALGSVARGEQMVIVGDRMQLPPTSFFDRIGEEETDDPERTEETLADAESILDVATVLYRPARMLRWHYRSRHGSLIAYSNKEFYKNKLIVFPSPTPESTGLGVKLIRVKNGVFESRRNRPEAERVVQAALKHMASRPNESLGIVTLNSVQRELVEELFEEQLKADPVAQEYIAESQKGLMPFFIKNLENVQGDERDVIYISVTYGPDSNGRVYQRFGPINGPHGHRRLNVLFTRARRRVVLFSSMLASDIQTTGTSAWGLRALKGYLHYAETGVLEQASFTGREPESDFEVEVATALRAQGLNVVAQVGVAGYFIDLAVRHPRKPDSFILGIECDGQSYHSSLSARDRDRLRQSILEDLGWNIHRIWSTDWFKHPNQEVDRLVSKIEKAIRDETVAESLSEVDADGDDSGLSLETTATSAAVLVGEEPDLSLTVSEARTLLLELRSLISAESNGGPSQTDLLRDDLVELLLRQRPTTRDEWLKRIPLDTRLATSDDQVRDHLGNVLEILRRLPK